MYSRPLRHDERMRFGEGGGEARLGGPGRARDEDRASTVVPATEHRIEPLDARGDALARRRDRSSSIVVLAATCIPARVIVSGNSFAECAAPRYFATRTNRCAVP